MSAPRLTDLAHQQVAAVLRDGDWAIDATAGNGHDTAFLARHVGAGGRVLAIDVQARALAATRARLREAGDALASRVTLVEACHTGLRAIVPERMHARIGAAMFNLGYLPGAPRTVRTEADTTARAIEAALALLRPGGVLTALAYTGHDGGPREAAWLAAQLDAGAHGVTWREIRPPGTAAAAPRLFVARVGARG